MAKKNKKYNDVNNDTYDMNDMLDDYEYSEVNYYKSKGKNRWDNKKRDKNKKRRLLKDDIDLIVNTFKNKEAIEDFSVAVSYDEIIEKNYSLSAGQYFDIKIDYVDITEEEFNSRMVEYKKTLNEQFAESHRLEEEIMKQLDALRFNANIGNNE